MERTPYRGRAYERKCKRHRIVILLFGLFSLTISFAVQFCECPPESKDLADYIQILAAVLVTIPASHILRHKLDNIFQRHKYVNIVMIVAIVATVFYCGWLIYHCANIYVNWIVKCALAIMMSLLYEAAVYIDEYNKK